MLKNYVSDNELQKFYPAIRSQIWTGKNTYSETIEQAYELVLSDFYNKGLNPRQCMVPLPLIENTSTTATNQKRLVVTVSTISGTWSISLEGSNDEATWTEVGAIDDISIATTYSVKFTNQHKYYRYTKVATVAGSMTEAVTLVETSFDNLIAYKALYLIFRTMIKENGDVFHVQTELMEKDYENAMNAAKFFFDSNDNNSITDEAKPIKSVDITFIR